MIQVVNYSEIDAIPYEYIRRKLVENNLLPDQKLYSNVADWTAAREAHINAEGSITDIFGVGLSESRDEKTYNRIIVDRLTKVKGSWGGAYTHFYEDKTVGSPGVRLFDKKAYPDTNYNVRYTVRIVSHSTQYDRILCSILDNWLPARNYCKTLDNNLNETENQVLIEYTGEYRIQSSKFIERVYQYIIRDVWLTEPKIIQANIPELTSVEMTVIDENRNQELIKEVLPLQP